MIQIHERTINQFQKERKKVTLIPFMNESIYNEIPRKEKGKENQQRSVPLGRREQLAPSYDLSPKSNSSGNSWAQNEIINRKKILSVHGANLPRTIKISGRIENVNGAG